MVNLNEIYSLMKKATEDTHVNNTSSRLVFDLANRVPELVKEIEQLRKDLAQMYEVTKNVHPR